MFSVLLLTRIVLLLKSKSTYVYFLNKQLGLIGLTNIHAEALHFIGQFQRANNHLTELSASDMRRLDVKQFGHRSSPPYPPQYNTCITFTRT
jgi:hypothetical protein